MTKHLNNLTDYALKQAHAIAGDELTEFSIKLMDDKKTLLVTVVYGSLLNKKIKCYFLTARKSIYQIRNGKKNYISFLSDIKEV